ncbi:hypothetical protein V6N12_059204 [Hibiscus sabdariffa]|uniref:Uncharacterized protein n=1 Tax=Hibiscus sabdariffa TaxID=183260 RepID=A0ABR2EUF7_9ROSI
MAEKDGAGLNKLQFTMRMPTSFDLTPIFSKSESSAPNMTALARASTMHRLRYLQSSSGTSRLTVYDHLQVCNKRSRGGKPAWTAWQSRDQGERIQPENQLVS